MSLDLGPVGIWTSSAPWHTAEDTLGDAAAELEELGYGTLWLGSARGDLQLPEALLAATRRLVVATGIVNIWTEPAATTAASYRRVAAAHPDRLLLGLGAGHARFVEAQTGQRYTRPLHRMEGYLDELDAQTPAVPHDRLVLASLGPKSLEMAARRTAGAHPYLVTPEHTRLARRIMGPDALLAPEQKVLLETDPAAARPVARQTLHLYLQLPNYTNNLLRLGFTADDLEGEGSDRLVDAIVAWGDVDTVVARVAEHLDAGADHVCIQVLTPDLDAGGGRTLPREQWRTLAGPLTALRARPAPARQ
jgi:probable F420-dependent oxidoreductase